MAMIVTSVVALTVAALFVLNAFRSNLVYFYSPTEVLDGKAPVDRTFRIGGMVENASVVRKPNSLKVSFVVTDLRNRLPVYFEGILPDLFREGQGIVVQGKLRGIPTLPPGPGRPPLVSRRFSTISPRSGPDNRQAHRAADDRSRRQPVRKGV